MAEKFACRNGGINADIFAHIIAGYFPNNEDKYWHTGWSFVRKLSCCWKMQVFTPFFAIFCPQDTAQAQWHMFHLQNRFLQENEFVSPFVKIACAAQSQHCSTPLFVGKLIERSSLNNIPSLDFISSIAFNQTFLPHRK